MWRAAGSCASVLPVSPRVDPIRTRAICHVVFGPRATVIVRVVRVPCGRDLVGPGRGAWQHDRCLPDGRGDAAHESSSKAGVPAAACGSCRSISDSDRRAEPGDRRRSSGARGSRQRTTQYRRRSAAIRDRHCSQPLDGLPRRLPRLGIGHARRRAGHPAADPGRSRVPELARRQPARGDGDRATAAGPRVRHRGRQTDRRSPAPDRRRLLQRLPLRVRRRRAAGTRSRLLARRASRREPRAGVRRACLRAPRPGRRDDVPPGDGRESAALCADGAGTAGRDPPDQPRRGRAIRSREFADGRIAVAASTAAGCQYPSGIAHRILAAARPAFQTKTGSPTCHRDR